MNKPQGVQPAELAGATGSDAAPADIAAHVNRLLDELKWMNAHQIKLHLKPTKSGWNLKLTKPTAPSPLAGATGYTTSHAKPFSVYAGETWTAYRPGEDERFTDAWVSRDRSGDLCTCVNSKKVLIANAKHNQVRLKWYNAEIRRGGA